MKIKNIIKFNLNIIHVYMQKGNIFICDNINT